ncbi:MAG: PIN domain-containing protein [Caulobacter sp.]|nr:PIN domain-containing protein [Caulobacter sp.]
MSAAFDTTTLLIAIAPAERVNTSVGGVIIPDAKARVDHLIATLEKSKQRLIIPVPALAEALVSVDPTVGGRFVERMSKTSSVFLAPFDVLEAMEASAMAAEALRGGDKRGGATGDYQKVKVDRQIVAIAKFHGASVIYSNDKDVRTLGKREGITVIGVEELPLPAKLVQPPLLERMNGDDK